MDTDATFDFGFAQANI